jgi:TolB-like protein
VAFTPPWGGLTAAGVARWTISEEDFMKTRILGIIAMGAAIMVGLASCATTVPIESVKKPTIDTTGIQKLGVVKDFDSGPGIGSANAEVLRRYLADRASELITATGKFTLVAPTDPNRDGVFTGELTTFATKDSQEAKQRTKKDADGNTVTENYTLYKRDVGVGFTYSIISARTGMPIGKVSKTGSDSSSAESPDKLTDPLTLAKSIGNSLLVAGGRGGGVLYREDPDVSALAKDIVPYIVTEKRKLMKETSKDKAVKAQMKVAMTLVKNKNYEEAITQFDAIAGESGSVAAKTNAGILREALSQTAAARAELTELFNDKDGIAEKAVKKAADALNAKLPSGSVIYIQKTKSPTDSNLIGYVVDELTKILLQTGITVIAQEDRDLIAAEQKYQAEGNVSDETAVSIGHELGVKYIVTCQVAGQQSGRRLNIKVLNVETAKIESQDDVEI